MNALAVALTMLANQQSGLAIDVPRDLLKQTPAQNQVLARVNGVEIKAMDVEPLLWEWRKNEVVNELITYALVKGATSKLGIDVPDAEVKKELESLIGNIKATLPPGRTIESAMEQEGTAPSRLFIRVKTEILLRKYIVRDLKPDEWVKVSTIVIKPASANTADLKVALEKADKAYNRLVGGENWSQVLISVTDDERARTSEGVVGWRQKSVFPETVAKEMDTLKKGGFTKPAQTQNGIQIFRIDALGKTATAEETLEMQASFVAGQRQAVLAKMREAAKIEKF